LNSSVRLNVPRLCFHARPLRGPAYFFIRNYRNYRIESLFRLGRSCRSYPSAFITLPRFRRRPFYIENLRERPVLIYCLRKAALISILWDHKGRDKGFTHYNIRIDYQFANNSGTHKRLVHPTHLSVSPVTVLLIEV
jgi:hypothetical protein